MRTVADVSAVADPATGLAVYDTFGWGGWLQVGGTSLATPIVASIYAMADHPAEPRYAEGLYRNQAALHDVVGGSNGTNCSGTYLCNAVRRIRRPDRARHARRREPVLDDAAPLIGRPAEQDARPPV